MRRSLRLVAASLWLLQLSACGAEQPAQAPLAPRPRPGAEASHVALAKPARTSGTLAPLQEPAENAGKSGKSSNVLTSQQLHARFARARALTAQHGSASYYSDALAGRSTASGAPYEPRGFTAAHRSLPFGSVLRVTRLDGGAVVYVRVTDRGPFGPRGRILDLSRAAAEQLGMLRVGVVKIKLEVVEYGPRKSRRRRH